MKVYILLCSLTIVVSPSLMAMMESKPICNSNITAVGYLKNNIEPELVLVLQVNFLEQNKKQLALRAHFNRWASVVYKSGN